MENTYVASGDFIISKKDQPKKFVALLGTCVGAAVFDKESRVGGICHILLPQPNDPSIVWQPKKYATTALPLFIDELLQAGAKQENLEAIIAGGSLCTPISTLDVALDIGGLNTENTVNFFNHHKIPITQSETGGCNTMSLTLNSSDCKVKIEHISRYLKSPTYEETPYKNPSAKDIEAAIETTKPIPQIALKIARIINKGDYDMHDLITELNSDQVLSAKLLSYCNSAFFGLRIKIDSTQKAISLLGETYLLEAIITTAVNSFFEQEKLGGYALMKGGLFKHSICVAHAARLISKTLNLENEYTVYTAGLLHDIGKIVLDNFVSKAQHIFYASAKDPVIDMIQLERKTFECDHQSIGQELAQRWKLPENIGEAISYHHTPQKAKQAKTLTHIVSLANVLASFFMAGLESQLIDTDSFYDSLKYVGLKEKDIPVIIDQIPWEKIMYA